MCERAATTKFSILRERLSVKESKKSNEINAQSLSNANLIQYLCVANKFGQIESLFIFQQKLCLDLMCKLVKPSNR